MRHSRYHRIRTKWIALGTLLFASACALRLPGSTAASPEMVEVDVAAFERTHLEQSRREAVPFPIPKSLRLFRLQPAYAAAHSHDVDGLRALAARALPDLADSPRIRPEILEGLSRGCTAGPTCTDPDDSSFIPSAAEKNVWFKYRGRQRTFSVTQSPANHSPSDPPFLREDRPMHLEEGGRVLFTGTVCQGTFDWPLLYVRLLDDRLAFEYLDGPCEGGSSWNTFYDGMNVNRTFHINASRQLFLYGGKIGFVSRAAAHPREERLHFNGRTVGPGFDCLRGFNHEDPTPPLLDLHANGLLLFGASRGKDIFIGVIDLKEPL